VWQIGTVSPYAHMRRFLPQLFLMMSLLLLLFAYFDYVRPPPKDPTPEMMALESRRALYFVEYLFFGCVFFLAGGLLIVGDWFKRRFL